MNNVRAFIVFMVLGGWLITTAQAQNIALGKPIVASSTGFGTPAMVNDGVNNQSSFWKGGSETSTITVDLGSVQTVSLATILLPAPWGARVQTFSILGSTDDSTFTQIVGSASYLFTPQYGNNVSISFAPTAVRYLQISFTGNTGDTGGEIGELQVFPDLAIGKGVTVSSTSYGTAAYITDGLVSQSSYWQGGGGSSTATLDLGSAQTVSQMAIALPSAWGNRTQTFSVQGSTDNVNFTTLASSATYQFQMRYGNIVNISFVPQSLRYLQLNFTANTGSGGAQVSELMVYNGPISFALNTPITANASNLPAASANDGILTQSSYWQGTGGYPQTLTLDMGEEIAVNSFDVRLVTTWPARTETFSVQTSEDGVNFTTTVPSATYSFNSSNSNCVAISIPVTEARYVQLVFTENTGNGSGQVGELDVYGSDDGVDASTNLVQGWNYTSGVLTVNTTGGVLKLTPFLDQAVHVQWGTQPDLAAASSYAVTRAPDTVTGTVTDTGTTLVLTTAKYTVDVAKSTSLLSFYDSTGKLLMREAAQGGRSNMNGGKVLAADNFQLTSNEALYGLGQYRDGLMNLRGHSRDLYQVNTQSAVPVVLSTNGWSMFWDNPAETIFADASSGMSFSSYYGNIVDYYLVVGSNLDTLVAGYRRLTGDVPMLPAWAYGYHQSRNRYAAQSTLLSVAQEMRTDNIPMDTIFIDYLYWINGCGSFTFDPGAWPNVPSMVSTLHNQNTELIVSVWPCFQPGNANYTTMSNNGYLIPGCMESEGIPYDVYNPAACTEYWNLVNSSLVPLGIDGWFLDGPEPEGNLSTSMTSVGLGATVQDAYPLLHVSNFYNGLVSAHPNQRQYIITRCSWAAQQRNGMTVWSGDLHGTFAELQLQIAAGLNYTASGLPYWTTDIGGYNGGATTDPAYQEIFTRWWEWGTFCPIFRSHGIRANDPTTGQPTTNELWEYGPTVQTNCTQFSNLRYRLLPYIYSLAGNITQSRYTPMRLLAFDFASDANVLDIKDQFMYGSAFLINPVYTAGATSRSVYLPAGTSWIDFWGGTTYTGGQTITASAPINLIPIYARAGSIVPMGPIMQYANLAAESPIEVRIYPGANGSFTLYEDDGKTFNYQSGAFSQIPFTWNESTQQLTIGARTGSFTGMLSSRTFNIVWVRSSGVGTGINPATPDATVTFTGSQLVVNRPAGAH